MTFIFEGQLPSNKAFSNQNNKHHLVSRYMYIIYNWYYIYIYTHLYIIDISGFFHPKKWWFFFPQPSMPQMSHCVWKTARRAAMRWGRRWISFWTGDKSGKVGGWVGWCTSKKARKNWHGWKNSGWKTSLSFWTGSFLGDILVYLDDVLLKVRWMYMFDYVPGPSSLGAINGC